MKKQNLKKNIIYKKKTSKFLKNKIKTKAQAKQCMPKFLKCFLNSSL